MLDFTNYQTIFNLNTTEERCRTVLDEIAPKVKSLFQDFTQNLNISLANENYFIHTYDATLTTTYHDARNPKYAEQKKVSDIGRKYFVKLMKRINTSEVNALTLEFNGLEQKVYICIETNFMPIWAAVRTKQLKQLLRNLPETVSVFSSQVNSGQPLQWEELEEFVKDCARSRKRPWFSFGTALELENGISEEQLLQLLEQYWKSLETVRQYLEEERQNFQLAKNILGALNEANQPFDLHLMGKNYQVSFGATEQDRQHTQNQPFSVYDNKQLVTTGAFYYFENAGITPLPGIAVDLEGRNHIFTTVWNLIGSGTKDWWLKKSFRMQSGNNTEISQTAMKLLKENGISVKESDYYVGAFHNENQQFEESTEAIKRRFVTAVLIFAHASGAIKLPEIDENKLEVEEVEITDEAPEFIPSFEFTSIFETINSSSFTFSMDVIRDFHLNLTAVDDKHFVILNGISGTGKTQLCRLYANAVYGLDYESDNPYFTIIPVRPDWMDATALFGYYSTFEKTYVKTEFLKTILNAQEEREKPHFILLDEMNLAKVEYYLSDYLSAVEAKKPIPLHDRDDVTDVQKKISIPPNVYILGTINVDETTHSISDKVLDRAFVMTLSDVDFTSFWESVEQEMKTSLQEEFHDLQSLHNTLVPYDLHFGYRTMKEMLQKLHRNIQLPSEFIMDRNEALDRVISEKALPKLRGDERVGELLDRLEQVFTAKFGDDSVSLRHIKRMKKELDRYGTTQFWR